PGSVVLPTAGDCQGRWCALTFQNFDPGRTGPSSGVRGLRRCFARAVNARHAHEDAPGYFPAATADPTARVEPGLDSGQLKAAVRSEEDLRRDGPPDAPAADPPKVG